MTKKELIMNTLEKNMGYSPELDSDGDIRFLYQMKTIYIMTNDNDEQYVSVLLPQFYEFEEGQETLMLAVCNRMTHEMKMAKVYIDQTFKNITASCEFYYANEEALEYTLRKALEIFSVIRSAFILKLEELSED